MAIKGGKIVGVGSKLTKLQTGLDIVGMTEIPVVSQGADLISGGISLATGDYYGAFLSATGLLPGVGQYAGALKIARNAKKISNATQSAKLLEVTSKAKKVEQAKQTEKFLDLTSKGRKVETPKTKTQSQPKHNEVNAKDADKEKVKEIESFHDKSVTGSKLDISDGPTNNIDVEKYRSYLKFQAASKQTGVSKQSQKSGYAQWFKYNETGKGLNNPTCGIGKISL